MKQAEIPRLYRGLVQLPRVHSSYNDDVKLAAFPPSDMTYADKQRRGIRENFESCTPIRDHVRRSLNGRFPLSSPIPMPGHIKEEAIFTRGCPPGELVKFRGAQLSRLEQLVADSKLAQQKRNDRILPEIATAAGKLNTVAISHLMHHFGIEGQRWARQFALGFRSPAPCRSSRLFVGVSRSPLFREEASCLSSPHHRFRERAAESGAANAQQLRGEATTRVGKGWLAPPLPLGSSGKLPGWEANSCNAAFRFGARQDSKLRARRLETQLNQSTMSSSHAYPAGVMGPFGTTVTAVRR